LLSSGANLHGMEKFLETVARYVFKHHSSGMDDVCLIFPNRRSSVFFTAYLQRLLVQPLIGPKHTTINEFITGFSTLQRAERLKLIAILYEVFRKHSGTKENFDSFYFWGEVLLSDFEDIDKYLVEAISLFQNIADLKEASSRFDFLEEAQKEVLLRFWGSLGKWETFKNQEKFLRIWRILGPVYHDFRERLVQEQIADEGMIFRQVAEKIRSGEGIPLAFNRYYIIGLNALNACEKEVLTYLKNAGKGVFLWDYDEVYRKDPKNEAGFFIRQNLAAYQPPEDFSPWKEGFNTEKKIQFFSVASLNGQAQILPQILENSDQSFDHTALVLADESLLFPVLGAIPESVASVNVTMGYPVRNASVYGLVSLLGNLMNNSGRENAPETGFYHRLVFDILNHQLLGEIETQKIREFQETARIQNKIYLNPEDLYFSPLHKRIFSIPRKVSEYGAYFRDVLKTLYFHVKGQRPDNKVLPELIVGIYQAFEKLETTLSEVESSGNLEISIPVFFRLLHQYLRQVSVSFEGEPLKGLQVMGILETRCLDFSNVVILGFNEDFWPRSSLAPSFIPYDLRLAFGLPTIDNQEAMYAYYFYRLIQRAENITATYNTVKEGIRSGEISRYGYQLIYDSKHTVHQKNLEFRFRSQEMKKLNVQSSDEIIHSLVKRFTLEKPLSPSALNTYIGCKYRFYLQYVAGLPESKKIAEEVDSRLFGNIFHQAVEQVYNLAGHTVTPEWIDKILNEKKAVDQAVQKAYAKEFFKTDHPSKIRFDGSTRLSYEFIRTYLQQLLKVDRELAPFDLISLEKKYIRMQKVTVHDRVLQIPLGGRIDRLDRVRGTLRVIDYKTGFVKSLSFSQVDQLFDGSQKDQKKEAFQAFLYGLIIREHFPGESIRPGIYILRKLFGNNYNPYFKINHKELSLDDVVDPLEENLALLLKELYSPENTFTQTEITEHCLTCPYKIICHRE
jgi:hypothetical protein